VASTGVCRHLVLSEIRQQPAVSTLAYGYPNQAEHTDQSDNHEL
jgi:hypothetical protein